MNAERAGPTSPAFFCPERSEGTLSDRKIAGRKSTRIHANQDHSCSFAKFEAKFLVESYDFAAVGFPPLRQAQGPDCRKKLIHSAALPRDPTEPRALPAMC